RVLAELAFRRIESVELPILEPRRHIFCCGALPNRFGHGDSVQVGWRRHAGDRGRSRQEIAEAPRQIAHTSRPHLALPANDHGNANAAFVQLSLLPAERSVAVEEIDGVALAALRAV